MSESPLPSISVEDAVVEDAVVEDAVNEALASGRPQKALGFLGALEPTAFILQGEAGPLADHLSTRPGEEDNSSMPNAGSIPAAQPGCDSPAVFARRCLAAGFSYDPPVGFHSLEWCPNAVFHHDYAIESDGGALEIRFSLLSNSAPFALDDFLVILSSFSRGELTPPQRFPSDAVRAELGADRRMYAPARPKPELATKVELCSVVAVHRSGIGTAITLHLIRNIAMGSDLMLQAFRSVQFET